jgi:hypothetical protein
MHPSQITCEGFYCLQDPLRNGRCKPDDRCVQHFDFGSLPCFKLLAGLHEEYQQARHWVANHLQFKEHSNVQFFEVNIRILGGLLSAYYLSDGDDMYLHKAQQLGDRWVLRLCCF